MATPTEAQARVLAALEGGAELRLHGRAERGPYYTLRGRRLPVTLLGALEGAGWIERDTPTRHTSSYRLTSAGHAALAEWRAANRPMP